jgi:hypothetical protein
MAEALSEVRNGMRIEWDVQIPVEAGYLAADVFRPDDDDQHPVLLAASPYAKGLPFAQAYRHQWTSLVRDHPEVMNRSSGTYQVWEYPDPERWVPHGYVCVRIDTRGTGASLRQPRIAVKVLCGVMHEDEVQSVHPKAIEAALDRFQCTRFRVVIDDTVVQAELEHLRIALVGVDLVQDEPAHLGAQHVVIAVVLGEVLA